MCSVQTHTIFSLTLCEDMLRFSGCFERTLGLVLSGGGEGGPCGRGLGLGTGLTGCCNRRRNDDISEQNTDF